MDKFQSYSCQLQTQVRNIKHLTDAILSLGLYPAIHGIKTYTIHAPHQYAPGTFKGLYHDPYELASLLWSLKEDCNAINTSSFLYIGTHTGYAFYAIREFLKCFVNANIRSTTIDPTLTLDALDHELRSYIEADFHPQKTSDAIANSNAAYDIVVIDGAPHDYASIKRDYNNVKRKARIVIIAHAHSEEFPDPHKFIVHDLFKQVKMRDVKCAAASSEKFGYTVVQLR